MKQIRVILYLTVFFCSLFCCSILADEKEVALQITRAWLMQIDAGEYGKSWEEAASLFKGSVRRKDWVDLLNRHRSPLGKVVSRKIEQSAYRKELPGAPQGDYVVIQFITQFEHRPATAETVTPMLEDGEWRVAGYSVW